jgi:hypothetical protein
VDVNPVSWSSPALTVQFVALPVAGEHAKHPFVMTMKRTQNIRLYSQVWTRVHSKFFRKTMHMLVGNAAMLTAS